MAREYTATAGQIADAIEIEASQILDPECRNLGAYQIQGEDMARTLNQAAIIMRLFGTEYLLEG